MPEHDGLTEIDNKFLNTGDLFVLRYNQGLVFAEVTGWEQIKYAPYNGVGEVQPEENSNFQRLTDGNDDILYVERREKKVLHTAIGQSPATVRRYTNYPDSENRLRKLQNLGSPVPGDDFGYVDGEDTPYSAPTDAEELFIPPGVHLDFAFYNPDTKAHEPILNIKLREYNIRPLDPQSQAGMDVARRALKPGSPIPIAPVGSPDNQARYNLEQYWGVSPVSTAEARRIAGGTNGGAGR